MMMAAPSLRKAEALATFTLGVGVTIAVPSIWAARHAAIAWLRGLAEQVASSLKWNRLQCFDAEETDLLHGRNKHDMTPAQLARRQMEDPLIALLLDLVAEASTWCDDAKAPQRQHGEKGIVQACARAESLIRAHLNGPSSSSELMRIAPRLVDYRFGRLWQPLPLLDAFHDYDAECFLSAREYIAPTFRELRNVCNLAQVRAAVPLRLVTLDGDKTLYPDRCTLEKESALVPLLFKLIERGVVVAMVTAVGFDSVEPYEARLKGLLDAIRQAGAPAELCGRLFVVGGQCNYLARCLPGEAKLQMLPPSEWQLPVMSSWDEASVDELLNVAGKALLEGAAKLRMRDKVKLVRKPRAVGILYLPDEVHRTTSLMLDEIAMGARAAVTRTGKQRRSHETRLPFCTFNGGKDVFVDIGSKDLGIAALQQLVDATPRDTLHIGDQFSITGNDLLARRACGTLWVDNPEETAVLLTYMLRMLDHTAGLVRLGGPK